ncbi:hypothetical protein KQI88_13185 [Alkaliphilus sp. MSJ-5]|uniref:Uncharacterized protein n=1 Tax=Alkaliphilus flagellatus TaxID=2841507 RepID=A0ABS6G4R7_9FIRM|nr:hypothetical protein [Alkaliphilus flagellatus]MBU5677369.1 hypothetical protein [Alkaliphilus flagellatus]
MFKRRRRHSSLKLTGLIITIVGALMFLYIIPLQIWYLIIAGLFVTIGLLIFKIC